MKNTIPVSIFAAMMISAASAVTAFCAGAADALDKSSAELAASLVMDKLRDDVLSRPPDEESLYSAMASDPAAFADPDESEKKLRKNFRDGIAAVYEEQARKLLEQLARPGKPEEVFTAGFAEEAVSPGESRLDETVGRSYKSAFANARKRACVEQAGELTSDIRPTEAEIDGTGREELTGLLSLRVAQAQKTAVFKENMAYISDRIVGPMLDDAYGQRKDQADNFAGMRVDGFAPSVIEKNLRGGIAGYVSGKSEKRIAEGKHPYGLFPSVTNNAAAAAGERAFGILLREIPAADVAVDPRSILAEMESAPEKHRTKKDSEAAFVPVFEKKLFDAAVKGVADRAPEGERGEFSAYAETRRGDDEAGKAVASKVRKVLIPEITAARDACADAQAGRLFPELVSRTWFPAADKVDEVCSKPDYGKTVLSWRKDPAMKDFADRERSAAVMEETSGKLDAAVTAAFDTGRKARTAQHGTVDRLYKDVRKMFPAGAEKQPEIGEIIKAYTKCVADSWDGEREAVLWDGVAPEARPSNAAAQHASLFPSTTEKITLMSKVMLEEIQKERETPPEEQTPPEETPPPEELEIIEMDCAVEIDRDGADIRFRMFLDGKSAGSFKCSSDPGSYSKTSSEAFSEIVNSLARSVREKTSKNRVSLTVVISVKDRFVYYGAVSELSMLVSDGMKQFGDYMPSFEISDDLK